MALKGYLWSHVNLVFFFLMAISSSSSLVRAGAAHGRHFRVGGKDGWVLSPSEPFNNWAETQRFRKLDVLFFKYKPGEDSVLLVSDTAYQSCNTSNPVNSFTDGNTWIELPHSGPFYFISGAPGHCEKGQKLIVVVLAERSPPSSPSPSSHPPAITPSPPSVAPTHPPAPVQPPAVAPVSPSAPSPQVEAPGPSVSAASLSVGFGAVGFMIVLIGWMIML